MQKYRNNKHTQKRPWPNLCHRLLEQCAPRAKMAGAKMATVRTQDSLWIVTWLLMGTSNVVYRFCFETLNGGLPLNMAPLGFKLCQNPFQTISHISFSDVEILCRICLVLNTCFSTFWLGFWGAMTKRTSKSNSTPKDTLIDLFSGLYDWKSPKTSPYMSTKGLRVQGSKGLRV